MDPSLPVCSVVATAPDVLSPLSLILESVLKADQQTMERTKTKILSALISVLQIQGLNGETRCCRLRENLKSVFEYKFPSFAHQEETFPSSLSCCRPCVRQ